jgi:hypothetical protein
VSQHTLDQAPLALPTRRAGLWQFRHVTPKLRTKRKRNLIAAFNASHKDALVGTRA